MKNSFGLSMVEDFRFMLQQPQLDLLINLSKEINSPIPEFYIYFVVRTPRISFKNESLHIAKGQLNGTIKIQQKDEFIEIPFEYPLDGDSKNLEILLEYPYEVVDILYSDKQLYSKINATIFLTEFLQYTLDTEVIYIGRSFGKEGSRTALDRLPSHSTLQKIYSENRPDKSIWLLLFSFNRNSMVFLPPGINTDENNGFEKWSKFMEHSFAPYSKVAKSQEVKFTEAALIRYFQPHYNTEFKYNFPSRDHTVYSDCYSAELDYIGVEIEANYGMRLGTDSAALNFNHNIFFDLNGERNFKDMFRIPYEK
ncbi:hypothetical protein [Paenibacillus sp. DR312]|uniref:hypothetical protein n=1 Tax=Paenibacillus sp. DR312 TaxID=2871175 RepID=UPI001C94C2AD|nr:hypothetical protein [Paenibacillus sp. DR312]QZN77673.1 hypothetical protein K5K90_11060 [Paenibacillus sp. DR312]